MITRITYLTKFLVFTCIILFVNHVRANDSLTLSEKNSIREQIILEQSKIKNLHVKFTEKVTNNDGSPIVRSEYEWAKSDIKRFCKHTFYTPLNEPPSERYGLAVWDGQFLKSYDSEIDNGSIRNEHNDNNPKLPVTYSTYARQFGTLTNGTLSDILSKTQIDDWVMEWCSNGEKVTLSNNLPGWERRWTVDLSKGCMISEFISTAKLQDGKLASTLTMTVEKSKEVKPGIWMPLESKHHAVFYSFNNGKEDLVVDNDVIVEEIKMNEPAIEELFQFEFPEKTRYWDYINNRPAGSSAIKVGEHAPDFNFKDIQGNRHKLSDFQHKIIFLDFWATWCPPCKKQLTHIKNISRAFSKNDQVVIIGLNVDKDFVTFREYIENNNLEWMQGYLGEFPRSPVLQKYGIEYIPANFLINRKGEIIAINLTTEKIESAIEEAIKEGGFKMTLTL